MDEKGAMDERTKKAFDFISEITKQIITLSTAIIVAIVTFFDKTSDVTTLHSVSIKFILVIYLLSVVFGIFTFMSLVGDIARSDIPSPYATSIRVFGGIQILSFLSATAWIIFIVA